MSATSQSDAQTTAQTEVQPSVYQQAHTEVTSYINGFVANTKVFNDGLPTADETYGITSMDGAYILQNMLNAYGITFTWAILKHEPSKNVHESSITIHWKEPETKTNRTPINDAGLRKLFIRGFMDAVLLPSSLARSTGVVNDTLSLKFAKSEAKLIKLIDQYLGEIKVQPTIYISADEQHLSYVFTLQNLNDFLLHTYNGYESLGVSENVMLVTKMITQVKGLNTNTPNVPVSKYTLVDPKAVAPRKNSFGDVGYDLTLIGVAKQLTFDCTLYETGVMVEPAHGWYAEVVPRSSISKTGYMLANCAGIIDPTYRGTIKVALVKINPNSPDLDLNNPDHCKPVQIIFRPYIHHAFVPVESDQMLKTERNDKGFGSTNNTN